MRKDKPTLHLGEHHLLHGKMADLAKPYAVIRRALALVPADGEGGGAVGEVEGDAEEEEDLEDDLLAMDRQTSNRPSAKAKGKGKQKEEEEEEEGPLFPDINITPPHTPKRGGQHPPSSPSSSMYPSSAMKDYSSELDFSSPPVSDTSTSKRDRDDESESEDEEEERRKKVKKSRKKERTRRYEVVGIVRKKVVFALRCVPLQPGHLSEKADGYRPEPIVTATILPE
jgi:hypothetical protein